MNKTLELIQAVPFDTLKDLVALSKDHDYDQLLADKHFRAIDDEIKLNMSIAQPMSHFVTEKYLLLEYITRTNNLKEENRKVAFIIDGKLRSNEYTPIELLNKTEEDILSDMEVCNCNLNESNNHCDGSCCVLDQSQITGYEFKNT